MDYAATLHYLYSQLPMYQRVGAPAFKKDLTNTLALCERLGNPEQEFRSIHIAGTNGKGSTSHLLAAMLQAQGYKVGLYTSPHYRDFRERIKVNGQLMDEEAVVQFVADNKAWMEEIEPSFFEITVGMAFWYFAQQKVDYAIIETGLGGRLDSTNVVTPLLSVITNIGYDHMQFLGNTLPEIAGEKAGIIKEGVPVVIGESHMETASVFEKKAAEKHSDICFADRLFHSDLLEKELGKGMRFRFYKGDKLLYDDIQTDLYGHYQLKNLTTALAAAQILQKSVKLEEAAIRKALADVRGIANFMGRWQVLNQEPLAICDSGHNVDGIKAILRELDDCVYDHLHFVIGAVNDKDLSAMLSQLPKDATYYFTKPDIPRGLDAVTLSHQAAMYDLKGQVYMSVKTAYQQALENADKGDLVLIGGSIFVVAEII